MTRAAGALLLILALAGCKPPAAKPVTAPTTSVGVLAPTSSSTVVAPTTATTAPPTTTIYGGRAPIPGAFNPAVSQATIRTTICVSGWTSTIRPPSTYTTALKVSQMATWHLPGTTADYEEDHLVPLELGGAPRDPANLWPEPRTGPTTASAKDVQENALHAEVCSGQLTLAAAQTLMLAEFGPP